MVVTEKEPLWLLKHVIEPARARGRVSLRAAAARAGISEATWRQLVSGGVMNRGRWVKRYPRRDQVLLMAAAVGCLDEAAEVMGANPDEVRMAQDGVVIVDPAEEEIMRLTRLTPYERTRLMETLRELRGDGHR